MEHSVLSVVVPCFNERDRLRRLLALIDANVALGWEWILVDDGSTDETPRLLRDFAGRSAADVRFVQQPRNTGKGAAVMAGFQTARQPYVGFADADLSSNPLLFRRFMEEKELRANRAIVIGTRRAGGDAEVKRSSPRRLIGRAFRHFVALATGLRVHDTQCGLKLLPAAPAKSIAERMITPGFAFDVELLLRCRAAGLAIIEIPIPWNEAPGSKVRWQHPFRMARAVLKVRRALRREQRRTAPHSATPRAITPAA